MKATLRAALFLGVLALATTAQAGESGLVLRPESKLWLDGKSTMHAYSSKATKLDAKILHDPALWPAGEVKGEALERLVRAKAVRSIEVVVGVTGMRSGKDGLDRNMQKALQAPQHPDIRFAMKSYEIGDGASAGEMAIDAKGAVTVAGVARDIDMKVTAVREGDALRLRGSVPLLMSQFGIKPPTMMMGSLRTADRVVVNFDLVLGAAGTATRAAGGE